MRFDPNNLDQGTVILIGAAFALACAIGLMINLFLKTRSPFRKRMTRINQRYTGKVVETAHRVSVKRQTSMSSFESLDKVLLRIIPKPAALRERLRMTGRPISIGEYALANVVVAAIIAWLFHRFIGLAWAPSILGGLAVGIGLPHLVVGMLIKRRLKKFTNLFPEAIDLIVRGLKSGLPVQEGVKVVAAEMEDPVSVEFREISDAIKLGTTIEDAMWDAAKRLDTPEFKFFVIALTIQKETGGNLTETLENLSDILRRRRQMRLKIKAMSSEARASALIIGALPFVMFGVLYMLNPGYIGQLFDENRGIVAVSIGAVWMVMGFAVMAKMVRFEI
jgi:tight adherence protein B